MSKHIRLCLWVSLAFLAGWGRGAAATEFGCPAGDMRANFDAKPKLTFLEITAADKIKEWRTHPSVKFEGFDAKQYGFTKVEFYRWHLAIPDRENAPADTFGYATDRLALAVHVISALGEHWFELTTQDGGSEEMLYFQPSSKLADNGEAGSDDAAEKNGKTTTGAKGDEMADWVTIEPASPVSALPLFSVKYADLERGMYQSDFYQWNLLLDLRSGTPRGLKALSCDQVETFSGAGSAMDAASETPSQLQCQWDNAATDFRCTHTVPYGDAHAARTAQKGFFLLSDRAVATPIDANHVADLGELALRIRQKPSNPPGAVVVSRLGPTTLLRGFEGVLPDANVMVFASPGTGSAFNARFSLVTTRPKEAPAVQPIALWAIGGEAMSDEQAPDGYLPLNANDSYQSRILEQRPGFVAFEAVLKARPENTPVHVVYWIGIEAVNGTVVANAVRVASDGYAYGNYGNEYLDSTASMIRRKASAAEATVRVQGQFNPEYESPYPSGEADCVWDGLLHWKAGSGFRVRKVKEDCQAQHLQVKITDEGTLQAGAPQ